jgi:hypothetical protein
MKMSKIIPENQIWSVFLNAGIFRVTKPSQYSLTCMKNAQRILAVRPN